MSLCCGQDSSILATVPRVQTGSPIPVWEGREREQVGNLRRRWESLTSCTQEGEENRAKPQIKPESFTTNCCC